MKFSFFILRPVLLLCIESNRGCSKVVRDWPTDQEVEGSNLLLFSPTYKIPQRDSSFKEIVAKMEH